MLIFKNIATGRPVYVDPHKAGAITDAVEPIPPTIEGAPMTYKVVGAIIVVDGAQLSVRGSAEEAHAAIEAARNPS